MFCFFFARHSLASILFFKDWHADYQFHSCKFIAHNVSPMGAVPPQFFNHFKLRPVSPLVRKTQNGIASLGELFAVFAPLP
jgi:hypothetical protein